MEASSDMGESENRRLAALAGTYEQRLEESAEKIKLLQENLKDSASDEIGSLVKQLELSATHQVPAGHPSDILL